MQVKATFEADCRVLARNFDSRKEVSRNAFAAVVAIAVGMQLLDNPVDSVSSLTPVFALEPASGLQD